MRVSALADASALERTYFEKLTDVELRRQREPERGIYLAESFKVITRALEQGHRPLAFLATEKWLGDLLELEAELSRRGDSFRRLLADVPVYLAPEGEVTNLTGFDVHRGALAAMERPEPLDPWQLLDDSRVVVVLEGLADHTNVGAIFRTVAALGADGVLLTASCADPLYRRAVRVSMGATLQIPWARIADWREAGPRIREAGYDLVAFAPHADAITLQELIARQPEKIALMFGTEGPGLTNKALASATTTVAIPMAHEVDSLNVATTAAISLWAVMTATSR